jgi:myosin-5
LPLQTKAGPILIAVNPLKEVPLYGKNVIRQYRQKLKNDPHVYAIADLAFNDMLRGLCYIRVGSLIYDLFSRYIF